jgi:hypothetical protein
MASLKDVSLGYAQAGAQVRFIKQSTEIDTNERMAIKISIVLRVIALA